MLQRCEAKADDTKMVEIRKASMAVTVAVSAVVSFVDIIAPHGELNLPPCASKSVDLDQSPVGALSALLRGSSIMGGIFLELLVS